MRRITFSFWLTMAVVASVLLSGCRDYAYAQSRYDLREYPSPGRGIIIMGSDLPATWFLDIWVNPAMAGGRPQGPSSFTFVPHPTYGERSREVEVAEGVGVVKLYIEAWERDRTGNRIIRAIKYPIVRYISWVPDYAGYYWTLRIGLAELGIGRSWRRPSPYFRRPQSPLRAGSEFIIVEPFSSAEEALKRAFEAGTFERR